MEENPTRKEFDDLKYIVENHKHRQYDQTKDLGLDSTRYIVWRVLDSGSFQSVASFGGDFEVPFDGTITAVYAYADTAGTTGSATIDIHLNGTTIMSATKISIETTEKSSRNATTQPVLTTTAVVTGNILTVDIDAIQTTPAKGLTVVLVITT